MNQKVLLLREILYFADVFKKPIYLNVEHNQKYSTFLGSFISLLFIPIILYLFLQSPMFLKIDPYVLDQTHRYSFSPMISLNNENFKLYFALTDNLQRAIPLDPSIFKFDLMYGRMDSHTNFSYSEFRKLIFCNESKQPGMKQVSQDLSLNHYLCPENTTFDLKGSHTEPEVSAFSVALSICNNETDGVVCQPIDKIREYFSQSYKGLTIGFNSYYYDVLNFNNPIQETLEFQAIAITMDQTKNRGFYFKNLKFINDHGWIFPNEEIINSFNVDDVVDYIGSTTLEHQNSFFNNMISFTIFASKKIQNVSRRYQNFQELLGNMNGTLSFLILIGYFLTSIQINLSLSTLLMNKLYSFPMTDSNNKNGKRSLFIKENLNFKKDNSSQSNPVVQATFELSKYNGSLKASKDIEITPKNNLKTEENEKKSLKINLFEYIKSKLPCFSKNSKIALFDKAEKLIQEELNIVHILEKVKELEKLKIILLNNEQLALFNLIAKPLIWTNLDGRQKEEKTPAMEISELIFHSKREETNFEILNRYIGTNEQDLSEIDKRILKLLGFK